LPNFVFLEVLFYSGLFGVLSHQPPPPPKKRKKNIYIYYIWTYKGFLDTERSRHEILVYVQVPLQSINICKGIKQNQTLVEMGIPFFEMPLVILVGCQLPTKLLLKFF
jgi:hypothetical protein